MVLSPREAYSNRKETKWQRANRATKDGFLDMGSLPAVPSTAVSVKRISQTSFPPRYFHMVTRARAIHLSITLPNYFIVNATKWRKQSKSFQRISQIY